MFCSFLSPNWKHYDKCDCCINLQTGLSLCVASCYFIQPFSVKNVQWIHMFHGYEIMQAFGYSF